MPDRDRETAVLALIGAARALLAGLGHERVPAYLADWPPAGRR